MRIQPTKNDLLAATCVFLSILCMPSAAKQGNSREKTAEQNNLIWAPPNVNASLPSAAAIPPCDLAKVLQGAGAHALELTTNLENFSAEEQIEYQMLDQNGLIEHSDAGVFDYVFAFEQRGGGRTSWEYRTPSKGYHNFDASGQDMGQVALALIFLPVMQSDYEMSCEGLDHWKGKAAWLIRFQQRKDRPRRTLQFRTEGGMYSAMLKGRAWISMEKEQVMRMESTLMHDIPALNIQSGTISVEYAPVEIQSRNLELWLPERIQAYWQISTHRIILYHTFRNFRLFSVDTQQNIQKPKEP
jgi:hypothetical protein